MKFLNEDNISSCLEIQQLSEKHLPYHWKKANSNPNNTSTVPVSKTALWVELLFSFFQNINASSIGQGLRILSC